MSENQDIKVLNGLDHIRLRPGMYIGDTSSPKTLLKEVVDNTLDEYLNKFSDKITIDYDDMGNYTVTDNGRGLPTHEMENEDGTKSVAAKILVTELFSGGKFDDSNYEYSQGLHGVGLTVVNALSTDMAIYVYNKKDKTVYELIIKNSEVVSENFTPFKEFEEGKKPLWATKITFKPDPTVFQSIRTITDITTLQLAKELVPEGEILVNGEKIKEHDFKADLDEELLADTLLENSASVNTFKITIKYGWSSHDFSFSKRGAINIGQCNEGWHIREARHCLARALVRLSPELSTQDVEYGLRMFVNILSSNPAYTSQTKEKSAWCSDSTKEVWDDLEDLVFKSMQDNPTTMRALIRKIIEYKKQMQKLTDRDFIDSVVRKGNDKRSSKGIKGIFDCTTKDRSQAELYVVEGKSAAGNLVQEGDKATQAVLPLRGKILNVAHLSDITEILENNEILTLINSIGVGISPDVDLDAARYGKIIIAVDSDADGSNISALIIGALISLLPELVTAGMLYEALAPLYKQNGVYYLPEDGHLVDKSKKFERYKGLGSMDSDELAEAILHTGTRKMRQITLDHAESVLDVITQSSEKKQIMIDEGIVVDTITDYQTLQDLNEVRVSTEEKLRDIHFLL